jgi:glycosyltransferase involved in cell wall biosynthesis
VTASNTQEPDGDRIRILHVTGSVSRLGAGVSSVICDLCRTGSPQGIDSFVAALRDSPDLGDYPAESEVRHTVYPIAKPDILRRSPELQAGIERMNGIDIVHSHGLWLPTGYYARRYAAERTLPLVISPHGMLEPWALGRSLWKKRLARWLFEAKNLRTAACLHVASEQEERSVRSVGYSGPVAVIPFGVAFPGQNTGPDKSLFHHTFPGLNETKIALFLSRLHPKKGLDALVSAWGELAASYPDWHLVIAGPDEGGYRQEIEALIRGRKLDGRVSLVGALFGDLKWSAYSAAKLFILPSYSENFGVVVAEALSSECPVITTTATPWKELHEYGCGWWIDIGSGPLIESLAEAISLPESELEAMGSRGRKMILERYSWNQSAKSFARMYRWLSNNQTAPEFVSFGNS